MTTDSTPIGYDILGDDRRSADGPAIVVLHPSAFGPDLVRPFAERLATDHLVVIPHRRGYGKSAELRSPLALDVHHDDLADLLGQLGLDTPDVEPPAIVGVSAGATLALGFAHREPTLGSMTIAHEPLIGRLAAALHDRVTSFIARLVANGNRPHETSVFMAELVGVETWNLLRPEWREAVETHRAAAVQEAALFARFRLDADDLELLGTRRVVTTVGERSQPMRQEAARVLSDHGVRRITVDGVTHLPIVEATDRYADLVSSLVRCRTDSEVINDR